MIIMIMVIMVIMVISLLKLRVGRETRLMNGNQVSRMVMILKWRVQLRSRKTFGIRLAEWKIRMIKIEMKNRMMSTVRTSLHKTLTNSK